MNKITGYLRIYACMALTAAYSIKSLFDVRKSGKSIFHVTARTWAKKIMKIVGVQIEVVGYENLVPGESYVYVGNHSSLLDIPVLLAAVEDDIRLMYKIELQKAPIFGPCIAKSPYIAIKRTDPRNAMSSLEEAVTSIKEGASIALFPEGTRSKDGNLGPFKRGAFALAARSGKRIVPVAFEGTAKLLPANTFLLVPGKVKITIFPPLTIKGDDRRSEMELMNTTHSIIENQLKG